MKEKAHQELTLHLCRSSQLNEEQAERLIAEVLAYFSESPDDYIRRRHRELQHQGLTNSEIFSTLALELPSRLFPATAISERQIRRTIYG